MSFDALAWVADGLVVLALVVMTIGVVGLRRMPDVYTQLHATSKAVVLGVVGILLASTASREPAIISRALLIGVFLLLTTPISAHVVARAAYLLREPMRTPGAVDESGRNLAGRTSGTESDDGRSDGVGLQNIVIGYDGSEEAKRALERAAEIAGDRGAVTLVTAGSMLPEAPRGERGDLDDDLTERRRVLDEGRARLAELGVVADVIEALGDPADALIDTAREIEADLIVVGTRGRTGAARVLLGSVSLNVVNRAHCDVLVVR